MDSLDVQVRRLHRAFSSRPGYTSVIAGAILGSIGLATVTAIEDYHRFIALGPGGVPYNLFGWVIVSFLLRPLSLRASDARYTGDYTNGGRPSKRIRTLPTRTGDLPTVGGIVPHRQLSQQGSKELRPQLQAIFHEMINNNPQLLEEKLSQYERHNPALYIHHDLLSDSKTPLPETARVAQGEIGHIHNDQSMHLYFSPADAKVVIEKRWGERHRLARRQPWYLGWQENLFGIAPTYLLIYGPRDERELGVAKVLLKASVSFMAGEEEVN